MPALAHLAEIELVQRWIMLKPIHHILRGILIQSRDHDSYFIPRWAVTHFCEPVAVFPLDWGTQIYNPEPKLWTWDDPGMPARFAKLVETEVLPILRRVNTFDDLVEFVGRTRLPGRHFEINHLRQMTLHAARGDLVSAGRALTDILEGRTVWSDPYYADEVMPFLMPMKRLLESNDRTGLVLQLREWEEMRIEKLRMRKIWEPTPFPLELMV